MIEISSTGGSPLDAYYDEFVFTGFIVGDLEPETTLYVPVVQECEKGINRCGSRSRLPASHRAIIPSLLRR